MLDFRPRSIVYQTLSVASRTCFLAQEEPRDLLVPLVAHLPPTRQSRRRFPAAFPRRGNQALTAGSDNASVIPNPRTFNANEITVDDGRPDEAQLLQAKSWTKLPVYGRRRVGPDAQAI